MFPNILRIWIIYCLFIGGFILDAYEKKSENHQADAETSSIVVNALHLDGPSSDPAINDNLFSSEDAKEIFPLHNTKLLQIRSRMLRKFSPFTEFEGLQRFPQTGAQKLESRKYPDRVHGRHLQTSEEKGIRLVRYGNDAGSGPGRIEVLSDFSSPNGDVQWGSICDDGKTKQFASQNAEILCNILGYPYLGEPNPHPVLFLGHSVYGEIDTSIPIALTELHCSLNASTVDECSATVPKDCYHEEDIWLDCRPTINTPVQVELYRNGANVGWGPGRLEITGRYLGTAGKRGTVCLHPSVWTTHDTVTVCASLGQYDSRIQRNKPFYGREVFADQIPYDTALSDNTLPMMIDTTTCLLNNVSFDNCLQLQVQQAMNDTQSIPIYEPFWGSHSCYYIEIMGQTSSLKNYYANQLWMDCNPGPERYQNLRLTQGTEEKQPGRLEFMYEGEWGTVCADNWGPKETLVACKSLFNDTLPPNTTTGLAYLGSKLFPQFMSMVNSSSPYFLSEVSCTGNEARLEECQAYPFRIAKCRSEPVWLDCKSTNTTNITVRLVHLVNQSVSVNTLGGPGRLEIQHPLSSTYGAVCDKQFTTKTAIVACRQLGYNFPLVSLQNKRKLRPFYTNGNYSFPDQRNNLGTSPPYFLQHFDCKGNESSLAECVTLPLGTSDCLPGANEIWLNCNPPPVPDSTLTVPPVRLMRYGKNAGLGPGRLEVYGNGIWGPVCNYGVSNATVEVVCKQLGAPPSSSKLWHWVLGGNIYYDWNQNNNSSPFIADGYTCTGNEVSLEDCTKYLVPYEKNCDPRNEVWLQCDGSCYAAATVAGPAFPLLNGPRGVTFDPLNKNILITDGIREQVLNLLPSNAIAEYIGNKDVRGTREGLGLAATFSGIQCITRVNGNDLLSSAFLVCNTLSGRISYISSAGNMTHLRLINGTIAVFKNPASIAVDNPSQATFITYVLDSGTHSIYRFSFMNGLLNGGHLELLAGSGRTDRYGFRNGIGIMARFFYPYGFTLNADKTKLFVADSMNGAIRIVDIMSRNVTTLVGPNWDWYNNSSTEGILGLGSLYFPVSLVFIPNSMDILVTDISFIRRITTENADSPPTGTITTFVGGGESFAYQVDGVGKSAVLNDVHSLHMTTKGTMFMVDEGYRSIRKVSTGGIVTTIVGPQYGYGEGSGTDTLFNRPAGLATDPLNGDLLVADEGNHVIRRIDLSTGEVSLVAGNAGKIGDNDGSNTESRFWGPTSIAVRANGDIIVADADNFRIRLISVNKTVTTIAGSGIMGFADGPADSASFRRIYGIASFGDIIYIMDAYNYRLRAIVNGNYVVTVAGKGLPGDGDGHGTNAYFNSGFGTICTDDEGNIIIVDMVNRLIRKVTPDGWVTTIAGRRNGPWEYAQGYVNTSNFDGEPKSVTFDSVTKSIFVIDFDGSSVYKITYANYMYKIMQGNPRGARQGIVGSWSMAIGACGILVDKRGHLFISDRFSHRITEIALLDNDECTNIYSDDTLGACKGGTKINWESKTCEPCPTGGAFGSPFSKYCLDKNGSVWKPSPAPPSDTSSIEEAKLLTSRNAAIGVTMVIFGFILYVFCRRRGPRLTASQRAASKDVHELVRHFVAENADKGATIKDDEKYTGITSVGKVLGTSILSSIVPVNILPRASTSTMVSGSSNTSTTGGPLSTRKKFETGHTTLFKWDDLIPEPRGRVMFGGFGAVFVAKWKKKKVAIKIPLTLLLQGDFSKDLAEQLLEEANGMLTALDKGANDYIVKLYGIAMGNTNPTWARACLRAKQYYAEKNRTQRTENASTRFSKFEKSTDPTKSFPPVPTSSLPSTISDTYKVVSNISNLSMYPRSNPETEDGFNTDHIDKEDDETVLHQTPHNLLGLVMEFVDWGSLRDLMFPPANKPVWPTKIIDRIRLCSEIATGLWHLHNVGMYHGDLKSENILITSNMEARVTDFGLSNLRESTAAASRVSSVRVADAKRGTWTYMAPEMYQSIIKAADGSIVTKLPTAAGFSTDIYALGTLFWEIITGLSPWADLQGLGVEPEANRLAKLQAGGNLDMNQIIAKGATNDVKKLIERCLDYDREKRPRIMDIQITMRQAYEIMQSKRFDVFLSNAWGPNCIRRPLTLQLYQILVESGLRVWLDSNEMGHDINESMLNGIANSNVVVALISPDYDRSRACMFELAIAAGYQYRRTDHDNIEITNFRDRNKIKPLVVAIVEEGMSLGTAPLKENQWRPSAQLVKYANLSAHMYVDLTIASKINWSQERISDDDMEKLTKSEVAVPRLLRLIDEAKSNTGKFINMYRTDEMHTILPLIEESEYTDSVSSSGNSPRLPIPSFGSTRNILASHVPVPPGNKSLLPSSLGASIRNLTGTTNNTGPSSGLQKGKSFKGSSLLSSLPTHHTKNVVPRNNTKKPAFVRSSSVLSRTSTNQFLQDLNTSHEGNISNVVRNPLSNVFGKPAV